MNNSMKFVLASIVATGTINLFADCPTSMDSLASQAKAAGWTSEGDLAGYCDPVCSEGKSAVPSFGADRKANAARCATYCKLKAEEPAFKGRDAKKAAKYQDASKVLSDYATKNKVTGCIPEKK